MKHEEDFLKIFCVKNWKVSAKRKSLVICSAVEMICYITDVKL